MILAFCCRTPMDKQTVNALLTSMIQSGEAVSDLIFIEGKPPLVDIHGRLHPFAIDTPGSLLTAKVIEELANEIIAGNDRLLTTFAATGSCDSSYELEGIARLRVNVYRQNGRQAIVMRKLQSEIPTIDTLQLPQIFRDIVKENNGTYA